MYTFSIWARVWRSTVHDWPLLEAHHTWWHSKWAPGLPLRAFFCVWVRPVFRISTSEDIVSESRLYLFFSFHPEAGSTKLRAAIRVTQRSAGVTVPDQNSISIFSTSCPKKMNYLMVVLGNFNFLASLSC